MALSPQETSKLVLPKNVNPTDNEALYRYCTAEDCPDANALVKKLKTVPHLLFDFFHAVGRDEEWRRANPLLAGRICEAAMSAADAMKQKIKIIDRLAIILSGGSGEHNLEIINGFITYIFFRRSRNEYDKLFQELSQIPIHFSLKILALKKDHKTVSVHYEREADKMGILLLQSSEYHSISRSSQREAVDFQQTCSVQPALQFDLNNGNLMWDTFLHYLALRIKNGDYDLLMEEVALLGLSSDDLRLRELADLFKENNGETPKEDLLSPYSSRFKGVMDKLKNKIPLYFALNQMIESANQQTLIPTASSSTGCHSASNDSFSFDDVWQTLLSYVQLCHTKGEFDVLMSDLAYMPLPAAFKISAISPEFAKTIADQDKKWKSIVEKPLKSISQFKKMSFLAKIDELRSKIETLTRQTGSFSRDPLVGSPPGNTRLEQRNDLAMLNRLMMDPGRPSPGMPIRVPAGSNAGDWRFSPPGPELQLLGIPRRQSYTGVPSSDFGGSSGVFSPPSGSPPKEGEKKL